MRTAARADSSDGLAGSMEAAVGGEGGTEWVAEAEAEEVLGRVPELMRSGDQCLGYALAVLERVACQLDDERQTKAMLRMLVLHATPHPALTRQLVEVIGCHEHPVWLVEVAAQLCDAGESGIDMIVELYKELLSRDRVFMVPVIGSLGELPLPASLKGQVLGMMQESLSIVEEADVPTVVRALLASLSPNTRVAIVRTLRHHASGLPSGSLPLVVELVGSALRADAAAASVYLQAVRHERRALSSLDIAVLVILGSRRGDRGSVYEVVLECVRAGTLHQDTLRATIGVPDSDAQTQPGHAATGQLLDMSYTPTWLALIDSLGRNAAAGEERVAAVIVAVYTALFCAHPMGRFEIVGALLRASIVPPLVVLQPAARAARAPAAGRQEAAPWSGTCGMVADSASRALVTLGSSELSALSDYAHLMEEALYHVAGEQLAYDRLCAVLGTMAAAKDGLLGNLMVFCRKQLFSAVDGMQRAAVTLATHIIHQPEVPDEDKSALLGLALSATTKQRSLGGAMVELCAMITYNITQFSERQLRDVFEQTLLPALKREAGGQGQRQQVGGAAGTGQLVEVGPASDHVDLPTGVGINPTTKMLRLVTTQWVRKYHPQVTIGVGAKPSTDWFERRPQILPALIRTYAIVGHRLGATPDAGCGVHLCRYYVPAAGVRLARRVSEMGPEMNSAEADDIAVTSHRAEAAEVAWCCFYTVAVARSALAAVIISDTEQQQGLDREESEEEACVVGMARRTLSFSYRWLRATEAAADELSSWNGDEESTAVRAALLSLPPLPRGLLSRVLSHVSQPARSGETAADSGSDSLVEEIGAEQYLLHGVHDQLVRQAEKTQHAALCRWASRGDQAAGVVYGCAHMRDPIPLCTTDASDSETCAELDSNLANALMLLLGKYSKLADHSLRQLRQRQYPAGSPRDGDSGDGLLDAYDTDCLPACDALCTIWRLIAVSLELGARRTNGQQEWLLCLARACLGSHQPMGSGSLPGTAESQDGQWARRVLFAYVEAHFLQVVEPHVALLTLDVLVSLCRNDESDSLRIDAVAKLYGRFLQTKYSHIVPQLSVRLPSYPLVALLCASIRGEGRGEDVADRWSALLLKMCNSAPKTAATETGSGLSASAGSQCEKRLTHHALVSLSVLVSSAAATRTAPSSGGAIEMFPVATDVLGCIETFFTQDEREHPGAAQSMFVLPAITPVTLPLFMDLVLRVSSLFDFSAKAPRGSTRTETQDEAWSASIESLGAGLRLRQRLAFALWQLELAGVASGWSRSATNATTQRLLSHLAMALPAVRKRIQRDVLPVATSGGGDDNQNADSNASAGQVGEPPAESDSLPSATSAIESCAEVVVSAAALVAQLRRLCALVKTREQERGVRLSQKSFGRGGRRGGRYGKYRTPDTDDDSDSDGLEDVDGDEEDDRELFTSPSPSNQAAANSPAGTVSASSVASMSSGQHQYAVPPQRKRLRQSPSTGMAHGGIRKHQRRRLVQPNHTDDDAVTGTTASDDADLDVTSELAGRDRMHHSAGEAADVSDDAAELESDDDGDDELRSAAATTVTPAAASMNTRAASSGMTPHVAITSPAESGSGRGRRGRSVLSRVTYAVAALAEVLMSAPASMRAPLLEEGSLQADRNATRAQLQTNATVTTDENTAGTAAAATAATAAAAAPIDLRTPGTALVVSTSSGMQPRTQPQFLLPLETRPTVPAATANKGVHENTRSSEFMGSMPRARANRDEAVKAANLADGYDSTDSDDDENDDDGLGGMRVGAIRKKPMRAPASADAFRAVPRDPQVQDNKSSQTPGIVAAGSGDSIESQSKVAALEARLAEKPTQPTTTWGQSPDPRR